jgi:RNA polymerase sigma-70 factor (ECF subfamily)
MSKAGLLPLTRLVADDFKGAVLKSLDDLFRYALSISHDTLLAEDLVSETVLKALENKEKLKDPSKQKQWMLRMITNSFIDQSRRLKRIKNIPLETNRSDNQPFSLYEAISHSTFTDDATPEVKLIQKLSSEKIQSAIKQLPDTFRIAFVLCDIEELSYHEIALTLELRIGTVRSRIARARSMLQKLLWKDALEAGIKIKKKKKESNCDC